MEENSFLFFLALKLSRTVKELLESITENELTMWSHYFEKPDSERKNEIQLAQLSSVLVNMNGGKTTTQDFMLDFRENRKLTMEERVEESANKFAKDFKKI